MQQVIFSLHSYNRYLLLIVLLFVLYRSFTGWFMSKPYAKADNGAGAALLGLTHLQLLLGLALFFHPDTSWTRGLFNGEGIDMSNPWQRYFVVEHTLSMLIAVVLIQLGRTFSKKAQDPKEKHRKVAIYTAVAVLIIVGTLASKGLLFASRVAPSL